MRLRTAYRTSSPIECNSSLSMILALYVSTVLALISKMLATCLLFLPSAKSWMTSSSLGESLLTRRCAGCNSDGATGFGYQSAVNERGRRRTCKIARASDTQSLSSSKDCANNSTLSPVPWSSRLSPTMFLLTSKSTLTSLRERLRRDCSNFMVLVIYKTVAPIWFTLPRGFASGK
jgi:hypothetical protein